MRYSYGRQDFKTFERSEENCFLMTNGLGGFSSMTAAFSCSRNDHALLMSCKKDEAPNHRYNMIHRCVEKLCIGESEYFLSTQNFGDENPEDGYKYISSFYVDDCPVWRYDISGVEITRSLVLSCDDNTVALKYTINNRSGKEVCLKVIPQLQFIPKGQILDKAQEFTFSDNVIISNGQKLYLKTTGNVTVFETEYDDRLYYAYDVCDGRAENGATASNHYIEFKCNAGENRTDSIVYGFDNIEDDFDTLYNKLKEYRKKLLDAAGFENETAKALTLAANQFISHRASTDQKTILAGFPFFEDWGRDTMISLTGCCISTRQFDTAKSILRTFMKYCSKGLMPNLFPEGKNEPWYNTVDAALLFVIAIYEYYKATNDREFVEEAWDVMNQIVDNYEKGTDFNIGMDDDGLIHAGGGYDQVTWMDVRYEDILPTPRHGKPVEINAYWYNVLRIMDYFTAELGKKADKDYMAMSELTKDSFNKLFWNEKDECLKDVISGTKADMQIRCNQIWAVSMPFSVLDADREKAVVECVYRELYTPVGLRTLSPSDEEFKPEYSGEMKKRDLSYHQGTTWTFPLGGYYLAYLKVNNHSNEAKKRVLEQLEAITCALREGCIGQLPEIYDGLRPVSSKGCFAQAWSVAEILRVYREL